MAITHILIESKTLASNTASITFTSIPQTYTDLRLVVSARTTATGDFRTYVLPNGSTSNHTNYNYYWTGSGIGLANYSSGDTGFFLTAADYTANAFGNGEIYFANYASSVAPKYISSDGVTENNATGAYAAMSASSWNDASPITSIQLAPTSGSFATHSTFYLYGIKKS